MRVENTSAREYGLSAVGHKSVSVPAATTSNDGTRTNGHADVDPEMLKLVRSEAWGAAVFGSGDLVVVEAPAAKGAATPHAAPHDDADHGHGPKAHKK